MFNYLFSVLLFLVSSYSSALTTPYYYNATKGTCSEQQGTMCADKFALWAASNTQGNGFSYQMGACTVSGSNVYVTGVELWTNPTTHVTSSSSSTIPAGSVNTIDCPSGTTLKLTGCSASCEADPCKIKQGEIFTKTVACGLATCPNGGQIVGTTNLGCNKGTALWMPTPQQSAVNDSCSGSLKPGFTPTTLRVPGSSIMQTSAVGYCDAQYVYDGAKGTNTSDVDSLLSLTYTGVTPTTPDGPCPAGTKKGQFGSPNPDGSVQYICVPDTPSDNQCPNGQVRDNTGTCVPNADAGQCAAGEVRNASGACVPPSTPPDNQQPNTPNQPNVPHGSGPLGSVGAGSSGSGTQPSGTTGSGSGSQKGAGSKTGSFTPTACQTEPECTGDPLGCAALLQDFRQNCAMMTITDQEATQSNDLAAASNNELQAASTATGNEINSMFSNFKDKASVSSSSACPSDLSLNVMSHYMTIPFSQACAFFKFLRLLVIISAYFASARIIFNSLG